MGKLHFRGTINKGPKTRYLYEVFGVLSNIPKEERAQVINAGADEISQVAIQKTLEDL